MGFHGKVCSGDVQSNIPATKNCNKECGLILVVILNLYRGCVNIINDLSANRGRCYECRDHFQYL